MTFSPNACCALSGKSPARQLSSARGRRVMACDQRHQPRAQLGEERAHRRHLHAVLGEVDRARSSGARSRGRTPRARGSARASSRAAAAPRRSRWPAARAPTPGRWPRCARSAAAMNADGTRVARSYSRRVTRTSAASSESAPCASRPRLERVEQAADRRIGEPLVREAAQQRELAAARLARRPAACRWPGPSAAPPRRRAGRRFPAGAP